MSAIVAVLNKQAVTLAADSAVTIGHSNRTKIFNRANKLFTLSKFNPIGIMVYNSASFMQTPLETIIKIYRENLSDKSFKTLREYQEDFIVFLRSKSFYADDESQKLELYQFCNSVLIKFIDEVTAKNKHLIDSRSPEKDTLLISNLVEMARLYSEEMISLGIFYDDFKDYEYNDFILFSKDIIDNILPNLITNYGYILTDEQMVVIYNFLFNYLRSKERLTNYSGLVFVGFGEDEIYPNLIPVYISLSIQNRLRYYIDDDNIIAISNKNSGCVMPFAQQDVMDTILKGIDDNLSGSYLRNFITSLNNQKEQIASMLDLINPEIAEEVRKLPNEPYSKEFFENNNQSIRTDYIDPMLTAVSQLSKEDLAEMAESLIYLTYLKRRITFADESVGGAVDVAIISKGDGFVWIKRKLYFDSKLNDHFLENYLNK